MADQSMTYFPVYVGICVKVFVLPYNNLLDINYFYIVHAKLY